MTTPVTIAATRFVAVAVHVPVVVHVTVRCSVKLAVPHHFVFIQLVLISEAVPVHINTLAIPEPDLFFVFQLNGTIGITNNTIFHLQLFLQLGTYAVLIVPELTILE